MSKKKGLSFEEKERRLLELMHEKRDVFLLKDLEKMAQKEKGIVSQSVKQCLENLVSEGLVESDKIGSSTYFWSFPSKAINTKMQKIEELKKKITELEIKSKQLDSQLKNYELTEEEIAIRDKAIEENAILEKERNRLRDRIETLKDLDPEIYEQNKKDIVVAKEAVNRWTDNIFLIISWIKNKFNFEESEVRKMLEIPEDFDYPDYN